MFRKKCELVSSSSKPSEGERNGERTSELDHIGLAVLASVVNDGFGVGLNDGIDKLVSKGLSDIGCGPKQAGDDDKETSDPI